MQHGLLDERSDALLPQQFRDLRPSLAGVGACMHYLRASALSDEVPPDEVAQALTAADRYLSVVPVEVAERLRLMGSMLRLGREGSDASPVDLDALDRVREVQADFFDSGGGAYPRVVAVANRALLSGDPGEVGAAVEAVTAFLADLGQGHPMAAEMQGLLCQLLALRSSVTASVADVPLALDAGVRAARLALDARGDAPGPTVFSMGPLVNALSIASTIDLRTGPFAQAQEVFEAVLARWDVEGSPGAGVDSDLRLLVLVGAGAAGLLLWRSTEQAEARTRGRARLDQAEQLLLTRKAATIEWVRSAFQVLQLHGTTAALWNDQDAAASALRLLPHIEQALADDPGVATQAQALLAPGGLARMGLPESGVGFREVLRTMRGGMEMLTATAPQTAGSGRSGAADRGTAEYLTAQALSGRGPDPNATLTQAARMAGMDVDQVRGMVSVIKSNPDMRRQLEAMMGPQAGMLDMFLQMADQVPDPETPAAGPTPRRAPATPPPSAPSDEDRLVRARSALARAHSVLPAGARVVTEPLHDRAALEHAISALVAAVDLGVPDATVRGQCRAVIALGRARLAWFAQPFRDAGLLEAVKDLNVVLAADRDEHPSLERVHLLDVRASCRRRLWPSGSQAGAEATSSARAALRELSRVVLAQEDLHERLAIATEAAPVVRRAVAWAIEDGRPQDALAVVENGRTLSLAAVLLSRQMSDLAGPAFDSLDHGDGTRSAAELVVDVSATMDGQALLRAPSIEELTLAVSTTDVDALVYLVPPSQQSSLDPYRGDDGEEEPSGYALVMRAAHDGITVVPLPVLLQRQSDVLDTYHAAYQRFVTAEAGDHDAAGRAGQAWQDALDELGRWSYSTIVEPLLSHIDTWGLRRVAHLGLVPVAEWAPLPFAAAWRPDPTIPGGRRYAVHDLALTHVPSGRAFLRAATAATRPIDEDVVVVIDPQRPSADEPAVLGLPFARAFGRSASSVFPGATVLQKTSGAGTADRVLAALPSSTTPGASLLHLSTHGRTTPDVAIQVADGWLALSRILDQARGIGPGRPGGTVIIDACVTDVMDTRATDDSPAALDEALTLATGMLAAGAKHVIGTRWPVPDGCAAVLAFHLHRHLAEGLSPAHALRAAQLDLLDGTGTAAIGTGALSRLPPTALAAPRAWAGYTHQGA